MIGPPFWITRTYYSACNTRLSSAKYIFCKIIANINIKNRKKKQKGSAFTKIAKVHRFRRIETNEKKGRNALFHASKRGVHLHFSRLSGEKDNFFAPFSDFFYFLLDN